MVLLGVSRTLLLILGPIVFSKFLLIWVMYTVYTCVNKYMYACACMHACVRGCVLIDCICI